MNTSLLGPICLNLVTIGATVPTAKVGPPPLPISVLPFHAGQSAYGCYESQFADALAALFWRWLVTVGMLGAGKMNDGVATRDAARTVGGYFIPIAWEFLVPSPAVLVTISSSATVLQQREPMQRRVGAQRSTTGQLNINGGRLTLI
jgi:hypothetical protein